MKQNMWLLGIWAHGHSPQPANLPDKSEVDRGAIRSTLIKNLL